MAQWIWQFSGETHATAVEDAEALLLHAVALLADETDPEKRRKRAKNARGLAKRVLRARIRFLKARISKRDEPREEITSNRAKELASLKRRLAETEERGIAGVLEDFDLADALAAVE